MSYSFQPRVLDAHLAASFSAMGLAVPTTFYEHPSRRSISPPFPYEPSDPLDPTIPGNPQNLYNVLERAAKKHPSNGVLYLEGVDEYGGRAREVFQSYAALFKEARSKSLAIRLHYRTMGKYNKPTGTKIVVLHLDGYQENLVWFWACIAAGAVPV